MSGSTALGRFAVVGTIAEADAFCRATGVAPAATLPLTYPMRWLALPDIRAGLLDLASGAEAVLVHESQSFAYTHPLFVDQLYTLTVFARREAAPDRVILDGVVTDAAGVEQLRIETILRLIAAPTELAA
ncbi:hypothetical protein [Beijerinckia sp. L45]|uniref:hypothetical protein n=1 Tax=Beijerinckia sp. L45 TaxID=1641855 RepID=UPI00131D3305|nr:hypothetical protein [Beijerinckia sp. L45]